jgi:hypothetical protein
VSTSTYQKLPRKAACPAALFKTSDRAMTHPPHESTPTHEAPTRIGCLIF